MSNFLNISGIGKATAQLLEAAGVTEVEVLAAAEVMELTAKLEQANQRLRVSKRPPPHRSVEKWIAAAQEMLANQIQLSNLPQPEPAAIVNYEQMPQVAAMVASAPFAIPLPSRSLSERKLAVSRIPEAILLNRHAGDLEVKVDEKIPRPNSARGHSEQKFNRVSAKNSVRVEMDHSRIKTMEESSVANPSLQMTAMLSGNTTQDDRVALMRGPSVETNQGRDPESRFFIRGVLHSHPFAMATGAICSLMLAITLPLGVVSAGLLLLSDQVPKSFGWAPKWLLVFPLALPVLAILYLIFAFGGSCRICGQKQFVPRACIKSPKAHYLWGLGYIVPVSFHMLVFKWFRCTYCGTPVRLKK